ncbi:folliculin-interacting protein 1-like [Watersipora subatra]|uniref:folliculin-interacting protein 1-like n=1 Tax=Watersipora subatra TaxID=2589382 RepID=UPI00355C6AD5
MAQVFYKIFQNKKYQTCSQTANQQKKSNTKWHVTRFTKEDINLVLFKDCGSSEKQAILDSRCLRRVTLDDLLCDKCLKLRKCGRRPSLYRPRCLACPGVNATISSLPKKYKNVCTGNKNDVTLVGEMIFGTTPLAGSGTTIKVHSLKNPHQLMLSSVFQYKRCKDQAPNDFDELDSFESSMYGLPRRNSENNLASLSSNTPIGSRPMDMPSLDCSYYGSDNSLNLSAASASSLHTPLPSPGANSAASINSCSRLSMMRRIRRSFNSSFQYNPATSSSASAHVSGFESPQHALSECSLSSSGRRRGARIGMAVIFTLDEFDDSRRDFETFFFSHITLIEGQLVALRTAIENYACEPKVIELVMEALDEFKDKVYDLYTARRLANPVWLAMMATSTHRYKVCEKFVREFTVLIERYDTKSTNNFVSTLLTGVLMYHLAWVPTVTPSGENNSSYADRHSAKWLDMLAKSHPYNPLWAQLSDMYGAIGMPPRLARTIVTGKKTDTIVKFLFVLSYFIRCSEIHETLDECFDEENLLQQLESALDDICVNSMEKDAEGRADFVLVDAPANSVLQDTEGETDSGLVSHYTGQSKQRRKSCGKQDTVGGESGFTESLGDGSLADVQRVPSSSPADKVSEWIISSQLSDSPSEDGLVEACTDSSINLHKSATDSTLVNSLANSAGLTPMSPARITCLPSPTEARVELVAPICRAPLISSSPIPETPDTKPWIKDGLNSIGNLRRLFSSEIDEMDDIFDGKPPSFSRQPSSTSQFDDLFDGSNLDSFSMLVPNPAEETETEPPTPTNNRNMLFKVMKEAGFHQHNSSTQHSDSTEQSTKECKTGPAKFTPMSPAVSSDDQFRDRNMSIGKQSSRCSTPQTVLCGGTTQCSGGRCRKLSAYQTMELDDEEPDPFAKYEELKMPRSTEVSKLADTSISTTSFGRQQLASFSDHYLSDFVLHGTSDDEVFTKVQKDLVASVEHSVLEDRISEAVCIVADTERWSVNVSSSMREQPKPLSASHLVINMVEAVSSLSKLKMSPEFILMHMEDRLQEMFFKSRMLSKYIHSRKKVDMDELDAMFGLEVSDIRFLLSVAATHSMVNVHGIY